MQVFLFVVGIIGGVVLLTITAIAVYLIKNAVEDYFDGTIFGFLKVLVIILGIVFLAILMSLEPFIFLSCSIHPEKEYCEKSVGHDDLQHYDYVKPGKIRGEY